MFDKLISYDFRHGGYVINDEALVEQIKPPESAHALLIPVDMRINFKKLALHGWSINWLAQFEGLYSPKTIESYRLAVRGFDVRRLYLDQGFLSGLVFTTQNPFSYYCIPTLRWPFASRATWEPAIHTLTASARNTSALLTGGLPDSAADSLLTSGIDLFDLSGGQFSNICGEGPGPCIHALALAYIFTKLMESEPLLLFHLKGLPVQQAIPLIRDRGENTRAPQGLSQIGNAASTSFWLGNALPIVPKIVPVAPDLARVSAAAGAEFTRIYKQLGDAARLALEDFADPELHIERVVFPTVPAPTLTAEMQVRCSELIAEFDRICTAHLPEPYRTPGSALIAALCVSSLAPLKGKKTTWVAAVIWALEMANFDTPTLPLETIAAWFTVAPQTISKKAGAIMKAVNAQPDDPRWALSPENNPWSWLVRVNGIVIDVRHLPSTLQHEAFKRGIITEAQYHSMQREPQTEEPTDG